MVAFAMALECKTGWPECVATLSRIEQQLTEVKSTVEQVNSSLFIGNGKPGLVTRLDRLEQSKSRHDMWLGIIAAAVLGGIALVAAERFWPDHHPQPTATAKP